MAAPHRRPLEGDAPLEYTPSAVFKGELLLRRFAEVLPSGFGIQGAVEHQASGCAVVGESTCSGVPRPDTFSGGGGGEQWSA
jgi:hypothetical protein